VGNDEAGLVGRYDGLRAVAQAELSQDAADVGLHRATAGSVIYPALIALLSLGVLAGWAAASLLVGGLTLRARDA
jgi:hypothetical protein